MARVKLLGKADAPVETRELFERIEANGASVLNLYRAVGHSAAAVAPFIKLGNALLKHAELPGRLRELAILRIATVLGSQYEWTQHVPIALEVGVDQAQIDAIRQWEGSSLFKDDERAVLRYTDELAAQVNVTEEAFEALRPHLSERGIVELTLSIGYWGMVARVLVPLMVEVEDNSVGSASDLLGKRKGGA